MLPAVCPVRPMVTPVSAWICAPRSRSSLHHLHGAGLGRTLLRNDLEDRGPAVLAECHRDGGHDVVHAADQVRDVVLQRLGLGFVQAGREFAHHHDGAGDAFAEAAGREVVGLVGLGVDRLGAAVRQAPAAAGRRAGPGCPAGARRPASATTGCLVTRPPQPRVLFSSSLALSAASWPASALWASALAQARLEMMRRPIRDSMAGVRVSATRTATATVPAAARPITLRNGKPGNHQGGQGDDDRQAGKEHGIAGGSGGACHGFFRVHSGPAAGSGGG